MNSSLVYYIVIININLKNDAFGDPTLNLINLKLAFYQTDEVAFQISTGNVKLPECQKNFHIFAAICNYFLKRDIF